MSTSLYICRTAVGEKRLRRGRNPLILESMKGKLATLDIDLEHPEKISWEGVISQMSTDHSINLIGLVDLFGTFCLSSAEAKRDFI